MELTRISACTYPIRIEPLDSSFATISKAGFGKVDLWGGAPNYANDPAECDVAAIGRKAAEYGLSIANLGTYPGRKFHSECYESEMREMRWAIDNARLLGARSIRVCPGEGEDPAITADLVPFFREAASYASKRGVYLGMENHRGSIAHDPALVMPLVEAVDSDYFGILLDAANIAFCGIDYREAYKAFRGHVVHVHVKDSRFVEGKYERTMLGEGEIDYPWIVEALERDGYAGDYALEFEIEKIVPVEDGLPKWLAFFRGIG